MICYFKTLMCTFCNNCLAFLSSLVCRGSLHLNMFYIIILWFLSLFTWYFYSIWYKDPLKYFHDKDDPIADFDVYFQGWCYLFRQVVSIYCRLFLKNFAYTDTMVLI